MANAVDPGRPPRLPRWTRQEILVLIEGKRAAESRGKGRAGGGPNRTGLGGASPVEPKWAAVAAYCRRHGVSRGPVQCRKRWSNLAGDFKKIKEWKGEESFWAMRNDLRRERRLPGFFDREVFDILDGVAAAAAAAVEGEGEEEAVFDSGRTAAEDGLFEEFEEEEEAAVAAEVVPISEKKCEDLQQESGGGDPEKKCEDLQQESGGDQGTAKEKQPAAETPDKEPSTSQEGQKRQRTSSQAAESGDGGLQNQLIEVFERNSRMLTAQLEAQNVNFQLDRDQRKDQTDGLLCVLSKVADALGRIADKL